MTPDQASMTAPTPMRHDSNRNTRRPNNKRETMKRMSHHKDSRPPPEGEARSKTRAGFAGDSERLPAAGSDFAGDSKRLPAAGSDFARDSERLPAAGSKINFQTNHKDIKKVLFQN